MLIDFDFISINLFTMSNISSLSSYPSSPMGGEDLNPKRTGADPSLKHTIDRRPTRESSESIDDLFSTTKFSTIVSPPFSPSLSTNNQPPSFSFPSLISPLIKQTSTSVTRQPSIGMLTTDEFSSSSSSHSNMVPNGRNLFLDDNLLCIPNTSNTSVFYRYASDILTAPSIWLPSILISMNLTSDIIPSSNPYTENKDLYNRKLITVLTPRSTTPAVEKKKTKTLTINPLPKSIPKGKGKKDVVKATITGTTPIDPSFTIDDDPFAMSDSVDEDSPSSGYGEDILSEIEENLKEQAVANLLSENDDDEEDDVKSIVTVEWTGIIPLESSTDDRQPLETTTASLPVLVTSSRTKRTGGSRRKRSYRETLTTENDGNDFSSSTVPPTIPGGTFSDPNNSTVASFPTIGGLFTPTPSPSSGFWSTMGMDALAFMPTPSPTNTTLPSRRKESYDSLTPLDDQETTVSLNDTRDNDRMNTLASISSYIEGEKLTPIFIPSAHVMVPPSPRFNTTNTGVTSTGVPVSLREQLLRRKYVTERSKYTESTTKH